MVVGAAPELRDSSSMRRIRAARPARCDTIPISTAPASGTAIRAPKAWCIP